MPIYNTDNQLTPAAPPSQLVGLCCKFVAPREPEMLPPCTCGSHWNRPYVMIPYPTNLTNRHLRAELKNVQKVVKTRLKTLRLLSIFTSCNNCSINGTRSKFSSFLLRHQIRVSPKKILGIFDWLTFAPIPLGWDVMEVVLTKFQANLGTFRGCKQIHILSWLPALAWPEILFLELFLGSKLQNLRATIPAVSFIMLTIHSS